MEIVDRLIDLLGKSKVLVGSDLDMRFSHIWRMSEPLTAKAVVLPESTEDVAVIMKCCYQYDQSVVVHGGLTNLVGSTNVSMDEIVLSMERLNSIVDIDAASRSMTVESGVILEHIHEAADALNLSFPLNFGAKGSAQIGGIISTNAGGLRVFRYGMTRSLVLGIEAVLADGTIISGLKKIIKDNSAYDLKQLFIGSEGTLAIVTKAVLKLVEKPKSRISAFVAISQYDQVVSFLKHLDSGLAGILSGYELIWGTSYQNMTSPPALSRPPLPHGASYYVLVEGLGSDYATDQSKLETLLESALEEGLIEDAAMANSASDLEWFWKIREDVHVLASQCTYDQHFDISLPIPVIGETVKGITSKLNSIDGVEEVYTFGHVADGNIHFIVGKVDESLELKKQIDFAVYSPLKDLGGSVSAEHGIGFDKKAYLELCRTDEEIELMKLLKRTLDPKNLLNRGKVLDL